MRLFGYGVLTSFGILGLCAHFLSQYQYELFFGWFGPQLPYLGIWAQKHRFGHILMKNCHMIVVERFLKAYWSVTFIGKDHL